MQDNKNTFSGTEDLDEIRRLIGSDAPESSDDLSLDDILTEFGDEPVPEAQPEPEAPRHARTAPEPEKESTTDDIWSELGLPESFAMEEGDDVLTDAELDALLADEPQPVEPDEMPAEPDQEAMEPSVSAPQPAEDPAAIRAQKEQELLRRREELKRANAKNNELQDSIASYVDAVMDEKKNASGERTTGRIQTASQPLPEAAPPTQTAKLAQNVPAENPEAADEPQPEPIPEPEKKQAQEDARLNISTDLRAFRNLKPDAAAVKAKRAVGYYSLCSGVTLILAVLCWYITTAPTYKLWLPKFLTYSERPYITLLVLVFFQCAALFIARSFIVDGLRALIKLDFKTETLLSLSAILTLLYTISIIIFPAWGGFLPCVPCAMFGLFVGLYARRQRYKSIRGCCRAASRAEGGYCVIKGMRDAQGNVRTVYKADPAPLKPEFMDSILEEDAGEGLMRYFAPITLAVTFVFALISSFGTHHGSFFLWHWSTLLTVAAPTGIILSQVVPFAAVSNKLSRIGVALMGARGIADIADAESAILGESDIFPTKMITVNGVKVFSGFTQEKVNLCTLSVLKASGSRLYNAFAASLPDQPMNLPAVDGFEFYETGGMGAYVNGEKVLIGTANFILRMAVRVPEGINLKNGILVAINMQFAGIFSIKYDIQPSVRRSLNFMIRHKITPVMAVRDFNMTPQLIESRFKINPESFDYPELEQRIAYSSISDSEMDDDCAIAAINNLHSFGEAISCGKRVKSAIKLNTILGYLSTCIGVPLIFYLLFMQSSTAVTPANIFYYLVLFFVPTLLSAFGANRR